jgi:hypothetical protein
MRIIFLLIIIMMMSIGTLNSLPITQEDVNTLKKLFSVGEGLLNPIVHFENKTVEALN